MIIMIDYTLNIVGSEWLIIVFVGILLLFGTKKLPEAGKKIGKIVGEYNKAKYEMQSQISDFTNPVLGKDGNTKSGNLSIDGPVKTERQKLENMAKAWEIDIGDKTDFELKKAIKEKLDERTKPGDEVKPKAKTAPKKEVKPK